MKIFAISDIHGRLKELESLITAAGITHSDMTVFLGDYIDRGPQSKEVIDLLIQRKKDCPNDRFIFGNHEEMAIEAQKEPLIMANWLRNGGSATLHSYNYKIPDTHWEFYSSLEAYVTFDSYVFAHAGFDPKKPLSSQTSEDLRWNCLYNPLDLKAQRQLICGHTMQRSGKPKIFGDALCIECYGWLTCYNLSDGIFTQVNNCGDIRTLSINDL